MTDMNNRISRSRKANPVPLSRYVPSLVEHLGLAPEFRLEKMKRNWDRIVGSANARNTLPVEIDGRTLVIAVSSPAWITQARFYAASFIVKINGFEPEDGYPIEQVRFVLDRFNRRTE